MGGLHHACIARAVLKVARLGRRQRPLIPIPSRIRMYSVCNICVSSASGGAGMA